MHHLRLLLLSLRTYILDLWLVQDRGGRQLHHDRAIAVMGFGRRSGGGVGGGSLIKFSLGVGQKWAVIVIDTATSQWHIIIAHMR